MSVKQYETFYNKYGEGVKHDNLNVDSLKKYKDKLPNDIYQLLEQDGISSYMNDFLWTLNPDDYIDWLNKWVRLNVECIPFARTALGDVFFIMDNLLSVLYANKGLVNHLIHRGDLFFDKYLSNDKFVDEKFNRQLFKKINKETRVLNYDECFGFVPILSLGGDEKYENLKKCRLKEYLYLLSEADGEIQVVL